MWKWSKFKIKKKCQKSICHLYDLEECKCNASYACVVCCKKGGENIKKCFPLNTNGHLRYLPHGYKCEIFGYHGSCSSTGFCNIESQVLNSISKFTIISMNFDRKILLHYFKSNMKIICSFSLLYAILITCISIITRYLLFLQRW